MSRLENKPTMSTLNKKFLERIYKMSHENESPKKMTLENKSRRK